LMIGGELEFLASPEIVTHLEKTNTIALWV
jgi:hypothetical protein